MNTEQATTRIADIQPSDLSEANALMYWCNTGLHYVFAHQYLPHLKACTECANGGEIHQEGKPGA